MTKQQKIPRVAILVSTSLEWGRNIVKGALSYAHQEGPWNTWITPVQPEDLDLFLEEAGGDGIVARVSTPELAKKILQSGLPVVNVGDTDVEGFSAPSVRTDDLTSTRLAAEYFAERGFKEVGFVGSWERPHVVWYAEAFKTVCAELGMSFHAFEQTASRRELHTAIPTWLESLPKPIGILTAGSSFGRIVVERCQSIGISVPHDVAVLSGNYDDLLSHACHPPLSGIRLPTEQIGYRAAQLLDRMMRGEEVEHKPTYLQPLGIMERQSADTLAVDDPHMATVIRCLRTHAFESMTMDEVLKEVPLARRSIERRFQKAFGRSLVDEVRRLRVNKARQLLVETSCPMQEIAEACGYATYNYMTRVFKEVTGMTPSEYRAELRIL